MFWRLYFLLIFFNITGSLFYYQFRAWDIVDFVVSTISFFGLYLFCWNKKYLPQIFWKIFFPINVLWFVVYFYFVPIQTEIMTQINSLPRSILATISLIMFFPMFISLYSYAFKSLNNQKFTEIFNKYFPSVKRRTESVFIKKTKYVLWRIFFVIYLVASFPYLFFDHSSVLGWLNFFVFIITILGLFAFVWKKKILTQIFWKLFFVFSLVWFQYSIFHLLPSPKPPEFEVTITIMIISIILFMIIAVPQFIALYLFAFESKDVWSDKKIGF